jgi:hypothetical protein
MTDRDFNNIVFGFFASRGYETQALLLLRSLRTFGGVMSGMPVWVFFPERSPLASSGQALLESLGAVCRPFKIEEDFLKFPFAGKAAASGEAEALAEAEGLLLAWHDRTGMVRQAPTAFQLPEDKVIGFRPTDIANIAASFGAPLPSFWAEISSHFNLTSADLPAITTAIDRQVVHLYVNAGLLVVRPARGILRKWSDALQDTFTLPTFKAFYRERQAYAIFMHQAILTAIIAGQTSPSERTILPDTYLFSVDNFFDYPPNFRPAALDEIVTGRFHDFFSLEDWEEKITASPELVTWFHEQLKMGPYWP